MPTIPALFATASEDALLSEGGWFRGAVPVPSGDGRMRFSEAVGSLPRSETRTDLVVVDSDSLRRRAFAPDVLKKMRARGRDIWLMTWVENAEDLFDAFNTTAETVIGPYHASSSDSDLKDIHSVSDCFVPAIFVSGGKAMARGRAFEDLDRVADRLCSLGFGDIVVVDTDGSVPDDRWEHLPDRAIPFVRKATEAMAGMRIIVPFAAPEGTGAPSTLQ